MRNARFKGTECETRYGIQSSYGFVLPSKRPVTGLACLKMGSTTGTVQQQVPVSGQTVNDTFNRANGAIAGSLSWLNFTDTTVFKESNVISGNQLITVPWATQARGNYWNQVLGPNQIATIRAVSSSADNNGPFGTCVRMDAAGLNGYFCDVHQGIITWGTYTAGARNARGNSSQGYNAADNDRVGLQVIRNLDGSATITVLKNGLALNYAPGTGGSSTWTDLAPIQNGFIGCYMLAGVGNAASVLMDDFQGGVPDSIATVNEVVALPERQIPIAFDDAANLYIENPVGSRVTQKITGPLVTLPAQAAMQVVSAYNKGLLSFTDLKKSLGQAAVYNPSTGKLDPLSMRLVGDLWQAGEKYQVGECICPATPVGGNGHLYRCVVSGVSGAVQPNFPTAQGANVVDGTVLWQEMTPTMSKSATEGNVAYGLRYMVTLFINRNGYISGMTQSSVSSVNIAAPEMTTSSYNTSQVSLVGNVMAYWWGDSPHAGSVGRYLWKNPSDPGGGIARTIATAVGSKQGTSLLFDTGLGRQETPVSWANFDDNGMMTGTQNLFDTKLEPEGFSDFNVIITASLYIPAAGTYTFQCKHKDEVMLGIGGDGASWAGKGGVTGFSGQTMTVAGGYPLLPTTFGGGDKPAVTDSIDVTFDAPGIYPIECNWDYWYHSGRIMTITCAPHSSPQQNIVPVSLTTSVINSSQYQLQVDSIPTGPENTVARICAFTPAGDDNGSLGTSISNAGPYFWIPPAAQYFTNTFDLSLVPGGVTVADVVNGVTMHSTLIADNTTTSATFNFTDDYLVKSNNDVSSYFRKIQIPPLVDAYFAKSIGRMFYAVDSLQSGWYVSLVDDPESVLGDTGIVQAAENNGENRVTVREYSGIIYLLKERSGYVLEVSPEDPAKWRARGQWEGSGPCGPRAVDVSTEFMCYVHRSGVWIFKGSQPFKISKEIPETWKTINWAAQHTIAVTIDDDTKEIHIEVPTGQSTVPDKELVLNYEECGDNFEPPLGTARDGSVMATSNCYKWSVNDLAANLVIRAQRPLPNPPNWMEAATRQSQLLYASSRDDGAISAVIPGVYNDNGEGIDWQVETASPPKVQRPCTLGGVMAYINGSGKIWLEVLGLHAPTNKKLLPDNQKMLSGGIAVIPLAKPCQAGTPFYHGAHGINECFRVRISNHKQPDVWGSIQSVAIFARPIASGR